MGGIKKSDICRGYDLGPACIACCVIVPICQNNPDFQHDFDMDFYLYSGRRTYHNGVYEERKAKVFEELEKGTKRFNGHPDIETILKTLKKAEHIHASKEGIDEFRNSNEFQALLKQFYTKTGFIGIIDSKPGCLLHGKYKEDLPEGCKSYVCELAEMAEKDTKIHDILKEFIKSEKPDSFAYSRIIHILAHHSRVHEDISVNRDNLTLDQLKYLHEFVQRTTDYKSIYDSAKNRI